jgi:hypothetical protein
MSVQDFDLLTMADVAALLHCSKAHVSKAIAGRVPGCPPIPAVSLGRRKLVRRQSLIAWLDANEKTLVGATMAVPERVLRSANKETWMRKADTRRDQSRSSVADGSRCGGLIEVEKAA